MNKETAELLAAVAIVRYMMDDCLTSNETPQKIRSAAAQADVALKRVELEIYRDVGKTPPQRNREDINKINNDLIEKQIQLKQYYKFFQKYFTL